MLILKNLVCSILVFLVGYLIVKVGWKLRYLVPLCFFGIFSLNFCVFWFFAQGGRHIELFSNGHFAPNEYAMSAILGGASLGGVAIFLLVISVLAIRYDVF